MLSLRIIQSSPIDPFPIEKILVAENHVPTTNNESLFILKFHNILRISR